MRAVIAEITAENLELKKDLRKIGLPRGGIVGGCWRLGFHFQKL